jgi:hypothetical protein
MENIVIELSRYNTSDTNDNSEWTNHLSKNVKIEAGDAIVVKQCFIDTRLIDNTSILIEQDIEWTLYFIYWINGHGINQVVYDNDEADKTTASIPDGLPYCLATMFNPTKGGSGLTPLYPYPLVDKFVVKIPKGTYERTYLATFITKQFESTKNPQNTPLSDLRWGNNLGFPVFSDPIPGSFPSTFEDTVPVDNPEKVVTPFQKPMLCAIADGDPVEIEYPIIFIYPDTVGNYRPAILNPFLNGVNGNYQYDSGELIVRISNAEIGQINIAGNPYYLYDGGYIGTSELALTYSDESSGRFAFQYMHTPLVNEGNECVGTYVQKIGTTSNYTQNKMNFFGAYSGIMFVETFTNFTPKDSSGNYLYDQDPFFQQIGMTYNDIICPDAKNLFVNEGIVLGVQEVSQGAVLQNNFLSHTTKNFFSTASLIDQSKTTTIGNYKITNNQSLYSFESYSFMDSTITDEVYFSNVPVSSTTNAGHYLIELTSYDNTYINDIKTHSIKATVSNFYLSGDSFTSTLGPDPYVYTHEGVPMSLSQVNVRILNPVTKEPADNVGPNSTVYLQIYKNNKSLDQPQQSQDEKKNIDNKK